MDQNVVLLISLVDSLGGWTARAEATGRLRTCGQVGCRGFYQSTSPRYCVNSILSITDRIQGFFGGPLHVVERGLSVLGTSGTKWKEGP